MNRGRAMVPNFRYSPRCGFIGDFSPKSPVGRAVYVVWALLGVATMTILISGV
jgi:hypothetical protein